MQVETREDDARDPTGEFIARVKTLLAKFDLVKVSKFFANLTTALAKFDLVKSYRTKLYRYRSTSTGTTGTCNPGAQHPKIKALGAPQGTVSERQTGETWGCVKGNALRAHKCLSNRNFPRHLVTSFLVICAVF